MLDNEKRKQFQACLAENPFGLSPRYTISINFREIVPTLLNYRLNIEERNYSPEAFIRAITPVFQRDNTQWTQRMQIKFVENVLAGYRSPILLYSTDIGGGHLENCFLLDGLQRMTAILAFQAGEFPVYDRFYYQDINHRSLNRNAVIDARFFHFEDDVAACRHYIAMNENITHSGEDIEKACQFIASQLVNS